LAQEKRFKALNAQRQKSMVEDTNKLLKLTTELNAVVNSEHARTLNADELRTVAEIEKLARSVREKMSTAAGPAQDMMQPPTMYGPSAPGMPNGSGFPSGR
jgi:hypothetical protein